MYFLKVKGIELSQKCWGDRKRNQTEGFNRAKLTQVLNAVLIFVDTCVENWEYDLERNKKKLLP